MFDRSFAISKPLHPESIHWNDSKRKVAIAFAFMGSGVGLHCCWLAVQDHSRSTLVLFRPLLISFKRSRSFGIASNRFSSLPVAAHPRNRHGAGYDMEAFAQVHPELRQFLYKRPAKTKDEPEWQRTTVDFGDASAVRALNSAILKHSYCVKWWEFPQGFLCPPVPGRADYIHHLAEMVEETGLRHKEVVVLDIGAGASIIYPLIGSAEYGWRFVAADITSGAIESAERLVQMNSLQHAIEIRQQHDVRNTLVGMVKQGERFVASMTNPPFFASDTDWKNNNTHKKKVLEKVEKLGLVKPRRNDEQASLNFGGNVEEAVCEGGEVGFISRLILQSASHELQYSCLWFTALVSREENLDNLRSMLRRAQVVESRLVNMCQGQKRSRFIAWTFVPRGERRAWIMDYYEYLRRRWGQPEGLA